jgi:hypothetical protein
LALSVVGLGVAGVLMQIDASAPAVAAQAEPAEAAPGLDLSVYSNAMQVRRGAGLADKDLAALGLSEVEATAVLQRLVTWCQTNEQALDESRRSVYQAERELADQQRLVRIGQATELQQADAGGKAQAVADAKRAHADLLDSAAAYAMQAPGIDSGKADAWQRSAELKGRVDSDLRYLPGMNTQRLDDLKAQSKQQKTNVEQVLSYNERQALAAARTQIKAQLPGVLKAVEAAMPLPVELRPVPEAVLLADEALNP